MKFKDALTKLLNSKRLGLLRTKMMFCGSCSNGYHWACERGLCLCWRTSHQTNPALNQPPEGVQVAALLWCQRCDHSFTTKPVTGRCEFCGGGLKPERNIPLLRSMGKR